MTLRRPLRAALAALVLLAGCSDAGHTPLSPGGEPSRIVAGGIDAGALLQFATVPDLTGPRHASKRIVAAEGGFVELNGFRVEIPAGALPADTVVTIDLPTDPTRAQRVMAEFGPHGIRFHKPVTLRFPLGGVPLTGAAVEVARWENGSWTSLGGTVNAARSVLTGTTPHFSAYGGKYVMAGG